MAALYTPGPGASLGRFDAGGAQIQAFGPQALPLSDEVSRFGVTAPPIDGWASCLALPDVWLEIKLQVAEEALSLALRFVGLRPEAPCGFVFYVKGETCAVGNEIFQPKSLRRFLGEAKSVRIANQFLIEASQPHKVQVVPLAGDGSFWDSQFLISFEMAPAIPQTFFTIVAK
jgi:hypothetical protein